MPLFRFARKAILIPLIGQRQPCRSDSLTEINLIGRMERGQAVDFDHFDSAMLARKDSHGRARNIEPLGDRGDQRQVGDSTGGGRRDPGMERLTIPTKPRPAGARMSANRQT